jgi:hypothetical protein
MTSFYRFISSKTQVPSFIPTFDGNQYTVTIVWNVSSQRYYVNCTDLTGNLIFFVPLISSESNLLISSLEWDINNNIIVATTEIPHNFPIGQIVNVSIIGAVPVTFNGNGNVLITNESQFTYTYPTDPGEYTYGASVGFLISMTKGYFNSTLIYRNGSFEVTP